MSDIRCKFCNRPSDPRWEKKYGCCFECMNNGVPGYEEDIAELKAENARLRVAVEKARGDLAHGFEEMAIRCLNEALSRKEG